MASLLVMGFVKESLGTLTVQFRGGALACLLDDGFFGFAGPGFSNNDSDNDYAAHIWYRWSAPRQLRIGMASCKRCWRAEWMSRSRWSELGCHTSHDAT